MYLWNVPNPFPFDICGNYESSIESMSKASDYGMSYWESTNYSDIQIT